jgi:agmatine deiminase
MKVGIVQMKMDKEKEKNIEKALKMISQASSLGAQIICLPELFSTLYFAQEEDQPQIFQTAEKIPGPTTKILSKAAKENKVVLIGGSIFEKSKGKYYNTSVVFEKNGQMIGKYRKVHIPNDECYFEKKYFSAGDRFFVFKSSFGKISSLICYDQWFVEASRIVTLMGAEIIFYPTAIGTVDGIEQSEGDWQGAWEKVMIGQAIANGTPIVAVNRCGKEGKMNFWGGSFVCDAFGKIIAKADEDEQVVVAELDLNHGKKVKEGWGFIKNRKPSAYKLLLR